MSELAAIAVIIAAAIALRTVVAAILRRLAILPENEELRSRGIRDVLEHLSGKSRRR